MPITGHRNTPIPNMLLQHITTSTDTAITKTLHTSQIKNITLGYNFEKNFVKKLGLSGLGVNISVENPYTFCDIRSVLNYDNSWFASYPTARSYVLGLNLSF